MKIITALSSTALLIACLGCSAPSESPEEVKSTEAAASATQDQGVQDEGAIESMDFESGEIPENSQADSTDDSGEETPDQGDEGSGDEPG